MKIIITGLHCSGKQEVLNLLQEDGFKCGQMFSNMKENELNNNQYKYYNDKTIGEVFDNNAYIYIKQLKNRNDLNVYYEGISSYDWDENDIFSLNSDVVANLNSVKDEIIYVWIDNTWTQRYEKWKDEGRKYNFDILEREEQENQQDFYDRLYNGKNTKVVYFSNEEPSRIKTIIKMLLKYPEMVDEIVDNFN